MVGLLRYDIEGRRQYGIIERQAIDGTIRWILLEQRIPFCDNLASYTCFIVIAQNITKKISFHFKECTVSHRDFRFLCLNSTFGQHTQSYGLDLYRSITAHRSDNLAELMVGYFFIGLLAPFKLQKWIISLDFFLLKDGPKFASDAIFEVLL